MSMNKTGPRIVSRPHPDSPILSDAHPEKPLIYTSRAIQERRRRILKETRRMIAENGIEGFSVRDLCKRAGVAQSTLYNAFQNKDRMIAIAIRETRDVFFERTRFDTDPLTLEGILDRSITSNRRNIQIKNYTRAVLAIYCSPTAHPDIWQVIQELATKPRTAWLRATQEKGQLQDWVDIETYAHLDANSEYSTINDWCQGRLTDDVFLLRIAEGILLHAVSALKGGARTRAVRLLTAIRSTGSLPDFLRDRSGV